MTNNEKAKAIMRLLDGHAYNLTRGYGDDFILWIRMKDKWVRDYMPKRIGLEIKLLKQVGNSA